MANVVISGSEAPLADRFEGWFVAHIDGANAQTLRAFYTELADALEIPDFGFTLESLDDALNDLQWLDEERIVLYVTNTEQLVSRERDPAKLQSVLNLLDATAEDWKWLADDEDVAPKQLALAFADSPRIRQLLDRAGIAFDALS